MRRLVGRAAAGGVAVAPAVFVAAPTVTADGPPAGDPADERARLDAALERAAGQLRALADRVGTEIGREEGEIFAAHAAFAADPELASRARAAIADGASAATAVAEAFADFRALLQASSSDHLAARAADLDDVRDRVLSVLAGAEVELSAPDRPSIIVARELTPSQTVLIPSPLIAGIATETGSPTSHAAILARSLGVPAVVGVDGLVDACSDGGLVAVDGRTGEVVVDPDEATRASFETRAAEEVERRAAHGLLQDEPARTADGRRVEVAANIGGEHDLEAAVGAGADGAGLVRTEFLYLDRAEAPSVEEQAAAVERVLRAFPGDRVVVRTLDVGADKPLPFVTRPPEDNPALGQRGVRLSLAEPSLFRDQLRALLLARIATGDEGARLAIMFPLVCLPAELSAARRHLAEVARDLGHDLDGIEVGVMVETPAAALCAPALAREADFLSIGTNDLLQYLFAADRLNAEVAHLGDAAEPLVVRLIAEVVDAAHAGDAWVGVCGEAASDPLLAALFVGLGVDELSMTGTAIPEVKATLRSITAAACRAAAAEARHLDDAASVRRALQDAVGSSGASAR